MARITMRVKRNEDDISAGGKLIMQMTEDMEDKVMYDLIQTDSMVIPLLKANINRASGLVVYVIPLDEVQVETWLKYVSKYHAIKLTEHFGPSLN